MKKEFLKQDELKTIMRDSIIRQEWMAEFAPPEGKAGQGGADITTELMGFKKDIVYMLEQPMLDKFLNGGISKDIADSLTTIAYEQKNASAGAFARNMAFIIRDRIEPDYLRNKAVEMNNFSELEKSGNDLLASLRSSHPSRDATEILDNMMIRMQEKDGFSATEFISQLKEIGDIYYSTGDEFLADEVDIITDTANKVINETKSDINNKIDSIVTNIQKQESNWENPLKENLSTNNKTTPVVKRTISLGNKI